MTLHDWKNIENNEIVDFEMIFDLECEENIMVADIGMSGRSEKLRWFIIELIPTREKKNLYVRI